jgi:RNA polymerase sigma-70 factor (ECF subfamily)
MELRGGLSVNGTLVLDDPAIKRGILAGDGSSLRALYDHARALYTFCFFRLGRDHHATEEVVQETLLLAVERITEFDPGRGDLHTWLAYLSRNLIRKANEARRRFFAAALPEVPIEDDEELAEGDTVAVALARIPAHYRTVLERRYARSESTRAIAEAEGTTEKAVESLLARARDAFLKAFLGAQQNRERCT